MKRSLVLPDPSRRRLTALAVFVLVLSVTATARAAQQTQTCGDLDGSGTIAASDALFLLKRAVGQQVAILCPGCVSLAAGLDTEAPRGAWSSLQSETCGDLDGSGTVAASDALILLKRAVGQNVAISCPTCTSTTTLVGPTTTLIGPTTTSVPQTTTTIVVPESCGNGIVDAGEECERSQGCTNDEHCGATCACESNGTPPPTSQELIAAALDRGDIDYPTSLLYRVWALFQDPRLGAEYDGAGAAEEDRELFRELSHMRGFLPAEIEAEIAPYLVRPDDPTSIFSQPPAALVGRGAALQSAEATASCRLNAQGDPDWRYYETTHFVVWSCGGGVGGTDPDGPKRAVVGAIAEDVFQRMQPKLGSLKPDSHAYGPAPQNRTDIYILALNQCRWRQNRCVGIEGGANAAEIVAPPCGRSSGGPLTTSGYLIVPSAKVPASVPGPDGPSPFRKTIVHEMFHLYQDTLNTEALGYRCTPDGNPGGFVNGSWLTESGAAWAPFVFAPNDDPEYRTISFEEYFQKRQPYSEGLQVVAGQQPGTDPSYDAFIYHTFVQQEMSGDPQFLLDFWLGNQSARNPLQLDQRLNGALPFADHFRDFAVRNVNRAGKGVSPLYAAMDSAIQPGVPPMSLVLTMKLEGAVKSSWGAWIGPLSARHDSFKIAPEVRWVRFDITPLLGHEHADIDVLANVRGTWQRRKVTGSIFEFCRDDAEDDISELYFVVSNHAFRTPDQTVTGDYETETKLACPKGWSGYIQLTSKLTRNSFEDYGGSAWASLTRTQREEHTWTVANTSDFFGAEQLNTGWVAQRDVYQESRDSSSACGEFYSTEEGYGHGLDSTEFLASPNGDGSFTLTPYKFEAGSFDVETTYSGYPCDAPVSVVTDTSTFYELLPLLTGVADLAVLTPDPEDPTRFRGSATIAHEETDLPGGKEINDISVDWSLVRRP